MATEIQTILFSRDDFTVNSAKKWLRENDFKAVKVDTTANYHRFRQKDPKKFKNDSFRTIKIADGIKAVIGIPMATKRNVFRNSTVRMESDLAMVAAEEDIPRTTRKGSMKKVFGTPLGEVNAQGNPIHIPKTKRGRPSNNSYWILDTYDSQKKKIATHIGTGSKRDAEYSAATFIGHRDKGRGRSRARVVKSALLSGPYKTKPNSRTPRK